MNARVVRTFGRPSQTLPKEALGNKTNSLTTGSFGEISFGAVDIPWIYVSFRYYRPDFKTYSPHPVFWCLLDRCWTPQNGIVPLKPSQKEHPSNQKRSHTTNPCPTKGAHPAPASPKPAWVLPNASEIAKSPRSLKGGDRRNAKARNANKSA